MSLAQITLTTNKTVSNVGDYIRKIGQGERGQVLPVVVTDANGAAYDLTNKSIVFSENKDSGKYVVDDGKASTSGKFTLTDPQNGKFSYTLQNQVYPESGTAWFDIINADGTVLDTTVSFRFVVIPAPTLHVNNDNYLSTLEALQAHYQGVIKNTETETNQLIDSLNKQIAQAISDGNKNVADEVSSIKEIIQQMQTEYKSKSDALAKLTSDWQTQTQTIQNSADDQLKKINENANSEIDKLKQDAADQLKSNQTANDAEINSVKQQLSDEIGRIETAKQDAIKAVSDAKDQAILAANKAYKDQLGAFQTDYDTWKNTTVADFQKQLDKLNQEITTETNTQNDLKQSVSDAVNTMQIMMKKLDGYDFTKFVTSEQIKNYTTKDEVKAMMDNAGKVKTVDNIQPDNNGNINTDHFTKGQANQKLATKLSFVKCDSPQAAYDASKKPADDGSLVIGIYDPDDGPTSAVIGDKTITISSLYESLQNLQTQVSGLSSLQSVVDGKANLADVYLKTDIDNTVNNLKDLIANAGKMKTISVNGGAKISPDGSGNANITFDLSSKANQTDLNNTNNRVTAIETGYMKKPTVISKADYDKLATKDPNTLYEITE